MVYQSQRNKEGFRSVASWKKIGQVQIVNMCFGEKTQTLTCHRRNVKLPSRPGLTPFGTFTAPNWNLLETNILPWDPGTQDSIGFQIFLKSKHVFDRIYAVSKGFQSCHCCSAFVIVLVDSKYFYMWTSSTSPVRRLLKNQETTVVEKFDNA